MCISRLLSPCRNSIGPSGADLCAISEPDGGPPLERQRRVSPHGSKPGVAAGERRWPATAIFFACVFLAGRVRAQSVEGEASIQSLKKMSIEQLMDIDVTSVSRHAEKLSDAPSAIQVITGDDIRRSGASSIPQALRLADNLEVAQVDSRQWAISARGFNATTADKLLVMIDGRTVYTPLYAGVFWDVQDYLLEDIDQIEVVSGPGGALWGANAVNGVINIKAKSAKDTQGLMLLGGGGSQLRGFGGVRYGGSLASGISYRVYGKYFDRNSEVFTNGKDASNGWHMGQGGFRMDCDASSTSLLTLQGDCYAGRMGQPLASAVTASGGNILGRWSQTVSETSDFTLQLYFDRANRRIPGTFAENLSTYDLDFQHHLLIGDRNEAVWGAGYRLMEDHTPTDYPILAFLPTRATRALYSAFMQDD